MNSPQETPRKEWSKHWLPIAFVLILSAPVVLVWLFYWEEDARGAKELAAVRAKWEAKGVSFNPEDYAPPSIPENQNLAAISIFKQTYGAEIGRDRAYRLYNDIKKLNFVSSLDPKLDGSFTSKVIYVKQNIYGIGGLGTSSKDELDRLNKIYPLWVDILKASRSRSQFRFKASYSGGYAGYDIITGLSQLAHFAAVRAILELDGGEPDLAFADFRVLMIFLKGLYQDAIGGEYQTKTIIDFDFILESGLQTHKWKDAQLLEIQFYISTMDFMETVKMCCERWTFFFNAQIDSFDSKSGSIIFRYWPKGWYDMSKAKIDDFQFTLATAIDSKAHVINVKLVNGVGRELMHDYSGSLGYGSISGQVHEIVVKAKAQANLDQAYIACALERYYLQKHCYPKQLEELVPQYAATLPHDVIGGKPYIYKLRPDGSFLLYSIGWNEVDDGGTAGPAYDPEDGDWVWPGHGEP